MKGSSHKWIIGSALVLIFVGAGAFIIFRGRVGQKEPVLPVPSVATTTTQITTIGQSVQGRAIEVYTFGTGDTHLLFVGGIHGGYEWNSVVLAYTFIDYFKNNPTVIPNTITISIIPSANPDGVYAVLGKEGRLMESDGIRDREATAPGRFNAHQVDLNRNFDCKWKSTSTWRSQTVSAGTSAFSEPEAQVLRNFIQKQKPKAVIFWHSQANGVFASECEQGILPETLDVMNAYAHASGYPAIKSFDAYPVSGDAEGWLASIGTPAITVELKTHETIEWENNLAGVQALLQYYHNRTVSTTTF